MTRSLELWVGKTDDAKVPPRVRLRVFEAHGGRCWISGRKIKPGDAWDLDHKLALCNGGRHSEDNLAPALRDKHREKTAEDVAVKSKTARVRAKHLGLWPKPLRQLRGRGFPKRFGDGMSSQVLRTVWTLNLTWDGRWWRYPDGWRHCPRQGRVRP